MSVSFEDFMQYFNSFLSNRHSVLFKVSIMDLLDFSKNLSLVLVLLYNVAFYMKSKGSLFFEKVYKPIAFLMVLSVVVLLIALVLEMLKFLQE